MPPGGGKGIPPGIPGMGGPLPAGDPEGGKGGKGGMPRPPGGGRKGGGAPLGPGGRLKGGGAMPAWWALVGGWKVGWHGLTRESKRWWGKPLSWHWWWSALWVQHWVGTGLAFGCVGGGDGVDY